jgi:leucyl-tRNA synthetase
MLAPMAPHFASELWSKLQETKNRLNVDTSEINWDKGVFEQAWPVVDKHFMLDFTIKVSLFFCLNEHSSVLKALVLALLGKRIRSKNSESAMSTLGQVDTSRMS